MRVRLFFDGTPLLEIGPLTTDVLGRGWEYAASQVGEWWGEFTREFPSQEAFEEELDELKALFGWRWTKAEYGRLAPRGGL